MPIFGTLNKAFRKTATQNTSLKVYSTPWKAIGASSEFSKNEPRVLLLEKNRPIYILRTDKKFRVFDMDGGGEYEWKVCQEQVMIRRRYAEVRN
ncbi:MAG: hypothetical protein ACYC2T_01870 [Bacillota bacterium]